MTGPDDRADDRDDQDRGEDAEIPWDAGNLGLSADDAAEPDPTGEIAAATADLDDDVPAGISTVVPNSPPLSLQVVESLQDRRPTEVPI